MKLFVSTRELANALDEHFPANEQKIRGWCEAGDIPPEIAKRDPGKARKKAKWFIKILELPSFLQSFLQLNPDEIQAIMHELKRQ